MPLMTWTEKMSVGVEVLDNDHKKLVDMVNTLFDGIQGGHGKEAVGKILDGLIAYTVEHFNREEAFFAKTGYPDAAAHKAQHEDLCKQVVDVQQKFKSGATPTLSLEVMNFLKNWLVNHIQGTDKKYSAYLNSHGIK
jgi:hemerythrin